MDFFIICVNHGGFVQRRPYLEHEVRGVCEPASLVLLQTQLRSSKCVRAESKAAIFRPTNEREFSLVKTMSAARTKSVTCGQKSKDGARKNKIE